MFAGGGGDKTSRYCCASPPAPTPVAPPLLKIDIAHTKKTAPHWFPVLQRRSAEFCLNLVNGDRSVPFHKMYRIQSLPVPGT